VTEKAIQLVQRKMSLLFPFEIFKSKMKLVSLCGRSR